MAYTAGDFDRDHIQLTWGGTLPGAETWTCSLKMGDARGGSPVIGNDAFIATIDLADYVGFAREPIENFHKAQGSWIHDQCLLTYVKAAKIQHDGRMASDDTSYEYVFPTPVGGYPNGGRVQYPNQVALAISLTTNVTRGPAHRGRFFMPMPSMPLSPQGVISTIDAQDVADSAAAFIESVSDVAGPDLPSSPGVIVMSRKQGGATARICTGVEVGRVLDTQRSRRRSLPEGYQVAAVSQGLA